MNVIYFMILFVGNLLTACDCHKAMTCEMVKIPQLYSKAKKHRFIDRHFDLSGMEVVK